MKTIGRISVLIFAAMWMSAGKGILAQEGTGADLGASAAPAGALAGRLTDLRSTPLAGISVILRNQATGAEFRTVTGKNGSYRFAGLEPGSYALEAESAELGRGQLEEIEVDSGHESRVQAAIEFEPAAPLLAVRPDSAAVPALAKPRAEIQVERTEMEPGLASEPLRTTPLVGRKAPETAELDPQTVAIAVTVQPVRTRNLPLAARLPPTEPALPSIAPPARQSAVVAALTVPPRLPSAQLPASLAGALIADATLNALANLARTPRLSAAASAAEQPGLAETAVSSTLTGQQLQALPVNGRRWQELFLDTPAAASDASGSQLVLRGAGQDPPDRTVDGASMRLAFGSATESPAALPAEDPSAQNQPAENDARPGWTGAVSEAAVREVRVVAGNVEAEGANAAGGRAGVETEGGGNPFHGQGFFFDRQNTWGARNPFTQWTQNTGTAAAPSFAEVPYTPPDHEISWGVGAGSRIRRNRLFWFAALDGSHRNDPGLATAKEAIGADQYGNCLGFFCPPSQPQALLLSAQLGESENQAYSDYMGIPRAGIAGAGLEQLAGLLGPAMRTAAEWTGFARLDWQAAERHRFTLEGTGADWNAPGGGLTRLSGNYGDHSFGSSQARQQWLLARWEAFLTPNLLAVTQASAGREVLSAPPDTPSAFEQGFLGSGWNSYGQLPQIVVDSRYGFTIGNPSRFGQGDYPDERMIRGQEMVDWVRGKLLVKSGLELDHDTDATTLLRNQTGSYHYSKVEDFISDALVFEKYGAAPNGWQMVPGGQAFSQHNCSPIGASLTGAVPCYSYFSQVIGPNAWQVTSNDWAAYTTAQWQVNKFAVFSAGLRWEREQAPPPIQALANPDLTQHANPAFPPGVTVPALGNEWGPRMSLALGNRGRWPVVRLGYGMYFGRTENASLETALTQTGSLKGDLNFFIRPTDGYTSATNTGSAPAFPNVLSGPPGSVVVPGAVEYAPNFHNPEVHQALAAVEQQLPAGIRLTASALLSLGRRLPANFDANLDPAVNPGTITAANPGITYQVCDQVPTTTGNPPTVNTQCGQLGLGPIKATEITVPFYALWPAADCSHSAATNIAGQCGWLNPDYQQITEVESRANSTYEAAMLRVTRYGERGLSLHAQYTYAHAMDWNPGESPLNPAIFSQQYAQEYGVGNLDIRHSAAVLLIYEAPWKLRGGMGPFANGWMLSAIGQFHSGLPYTMRVTGSLPKEITNTGAAIVGLAPGMNGAGGDNRVYGVGNNGQVYNIGRNTFRYPETWKADLRVGKKFVLGEGREFELLAESFNLFNHQNITEIETTGYTIDPGSAGSLPTLNFLTGLRTSSTTGLPIPGFGQPLNINATDFYRERQIELGARLRF